MGQIGDRRERKRERERETEREREKREREFLPEWFSNIPSKSLQCGHYDNLEVEQRTS